ncbi:MAG: hypothetical protein H0V52_03860, partial [Acidimicrobiia bacterium]|nr:hypothetical protein [Acidimicrobiia bacterium]
MESPPPALMPPSPPLEWHPYATLVPAALLLLVAGLVVAGQEGLTAVEVVRTALVVAWALAGGVLVVRRPLRALGLVILAGVGVAAVACLVSAMVKAGWSGFPGALAAVALPVSVALLPATALH